MLLSPLGWKSSHCLRGILGLRLETKLTGKNEVQLPFSRVTLSPPTSWWRCVSLAKVDVVPGLEKFLSEQGGRLDIMK